jgi:hypothetical protein
MEPMPKLQHQTRRDFRISVGGAQYEVDSEGCVDVSEAHAEGLLRGKKWKRHGEWAEWQRKITSTAPPVVAGARRARTRQEILGLAEAEGVKGATEALKTESTGAIELGDEELEEVVVSLDMKKAELVEIAERLDVDASGMTKVQIIEAIEKASQE